MPPSCSSSRPSMAFCLALARSSSGRAAAKTAPVRGSLVNSRTRKANSAGIWRRQAGGSSWCGSETNKMGRAPAFSASVLPGSRLQVLQGSGEAEAAALCGRLVCLFQFAAMNLPCSGAVVGAATWAAARYFSSSSAVPIRWPSMNTCGTVEPPLTPRTARGGTSFPTTTST